MLFNLYFIFSTFYRNNTIFNDFLKSLVNNDCFQISVLSIAAQSAGLDQISSFRALRTLRALRPLRAISRWQGMRVSHCLYSFPASYP